MYQHAMQCTVRKNMRREVFHRPITSRRQFHQHQGTCRPAAPPEVHRRVVTSSAMSDAFRSSSTHQAGRGPWSVDESFDERAPVNPPSSVDALRGMKPKTHIRPGPALSVGNFPFFPLPGAWACKCFASSSPPHLQRGCDSVCRSRAGGRDYWSC